MFNTEIEPAISVDLTGLFETLHGAPGSNVHAVPKISRVEQYLYADDGSRFFLKGIAYQMQGECLSTSHNLYLCFDLCTGGELFDCICAKGNYYEADAASLVRTIMTAVSYIHAGDIEPDIMIADFGLSRITEVSGRSFVSWKGWKNALWAAPETTELEDNWRRRAIRAQTSTRCTVWAFAHIHACASALGGRLNLCPVSKNVEGAFSMGTPSLRFTSARAGAYSYVDPRDEETLSLLAGICGALGYMAPEIFLKTASRSVIANGRPPSLPSRVTGDGSPYFVRISSGPRAMLSAQEMSFAALRCEREPGHSKPVDVLAMGVATYFLLAGYTPFDRDTPQVGGALCAWCGDAPTTAYGTVAIPNGDFSAVVGSLTDTVCGLLPGVGGSCADIGANGTSGCMVGLRNVFRVSVSLLLCCYPPACTAPLRFVALCCDSDHPILDPPYARLRASPRVFAPPSSGLRSIIPHPVLLVTALPPPRSRPRSPSSPRASSLAALAPPAFVVLLWPSPSFRFPVLSRFLLPSSSYSRASSSHLWRPYALLLALLSYPR
ncbi:hypothetical protein K438DRAFT_1994191 [Mycena galopus ATCC 62051]|nr:hypothetical protein K438DRAFT_1994191 [Mycena galopus ATCC 62051]